MTLEGILKGKKVLKREFSE